LSEEGLQCELPFAPFIRCDPYAVNVAVINAFNHRNLEVRMVERVERFATELQPQSFPQLDAPQQLKIHAAKSRPDQHVFIGKTADRN
jgi:hypothetical protein